MIDIKFIRENADLVRKACIDKNRAEVDIGRLLELDAERRRLIAATEAKRAEQNAAGERIAAERNPEAKRAAIESMQSLKAGLKADEEGMAAVAAEFSAILDRVPNVPFADVPVGRDESENVVVREVGERPKFGFPPKDHMELGLDLGLIDADRAAEVTGSRFTYLKGDLVLLQNALAQFAIGILTSRERLASVIAGAGLAVSDRPFVPVVPPLMIRPETFARMARLEPREERYHIPSDDLYLIGSAEHTLGPIHMDEILKEGEMPRRYFALTAAFRREAGSYGKDVRGIIRQHQFDKMEMESFSLPESSRSEQDLFVAIQEHILQSLGIPYRVVSICTGDMGAPDARQIDMECWMPGQDAYRETHTSDLMTDYQSRRLNTRVRRHGGEIEFAHMNDATVMAMGRLLVAIMENGQQADGTIAVPEALRPYMGGQSLIGRE